MHRNRLPTLLLAAATLALLAGVRPVAAAEEDEDAPVGAQAPAFSIEPPFLTTNLNGQTFTLLTDGRQIFAYSSSALPKLNPGTSATVTAMTITSPKSASVTIDVGAERFGTTEFVLERHDVDGKNVIAKHYFPVSCIGPFEEGDYTLSVTGTLPMAPDTEDPQAAGSLTIEGPVAGIVTVAAPDGVQFVPAATQAVTATSSTAGVTVSAPILSTDRKRVTFQVTSPVQGAAVAVTVGNIALDTAEFTARAGRVGDVLLDLTFGTITLPFEFPVGYIRDPAIKDEDIDPTKNNSNTSNPSLNQPRRDSPSSNSGDTDDPSSSSTPRNPGGSSGGSGPSAQPGGGASGDPGTPADGGSPGGVPPRPAPPPGPAVPRADKPAEPGDGKWEVHLTARDGIRLRVLPLPRPGETVRIWVEARSLTDPSPATDKRTLSVKLSWRAEPLAIEVVETGPTSALFRSDLRGVRVRRPAEGEARYQAASPTVRPGAYDRAAIDEALRGVPDGAVKLATAIGTLRGRLGYDAIFADGDVTAVGSADAVPDVTSALLAELGR